MTPEEWKQKWVGKMFKCKSTGEVLVIPSSVNMGDFFEFGDCFIDVGDVEYFRAGGEFEQVEIGDD